MTDLSMEDDPSFLFAWEVLKPGAILLSLDQDTVMFRNPDGMKIQVDIATDLCYVIRD